MNCASDKCIELEEPWRWEIQEIGEYRDDKMRALETMLLLSMHHTVAHLSRPIQRSDNEGGI